METTMYSRWILAALAALTVCSASIDWGSLNLREHHLSATLAAQAEPSLAFATWVHHFQKEYENDLQEYERRFEIWQDNLGFVHAYNAKERSHWLGLNHLADRTHEEYKHSLGYRPDLRAGAKSTLAPFMYEGVNPPQSVDWRKNGSVTPVKNQAQCGSCWAFSTTGSIEGINAIYTGKLASLSEQELVDCDVSRDHGCHGGLMDFAFTFVIQNGGLDTEQDYKYVAEEEKCAVRKEHRHVVTIDSYEDVPPNNEVALKKAVANQPVSVAIEADQREFQLYQGGIFDAECGTALDHGVLVVGYGHESGKDFWIVKNSWGPNWGDQGYIRLVRNVQNSVGQCGIAMQASYPVKKTPNPPTPGPTPPGPPPKPSPPGPPAPVACDASVSCPARSTCCCQREFFGYCLSWACCPLENAVCCEDQEHCCPHNLPVCDTAAGRCLSGKGMGFKDSVPWSSKTPAFKAHETRDWLPKLPWQQHGEGAIPEESTHVGQVLVA